MNSSKTLNSTINWAKPGFTYHFLILLSCSCINENPRRIHAPLRLHEFLFPRRSIHICNRNSRGWTTGEEGNPIITCAQSESPWEFKFV
ncbi:hypothetical protein CEXT_570781 [Caerostris extrusa]|uniref:Ycf15 n=1 Tax=Caerostris extrusa TaxID=172846 RepID=A0AAV4XYY7_CAEEX|nr:hypothetical protein CEXT_570781 [Caerostris extrusa]